MDPATTAPASTYGAWIAAVALGLLAVAVVGGALLTVRLITRVVDRIQDPASRLTTYECGEAPVGTAWFRFNNRFTVVALTFLIFDVELALLWPILPNALAWIGQGQGWRLFAEVGLFVGTLALGLVWVAAQGGFAWDRTVDDD
jgi:NADH-quinone oxidoreductase subunit A